MSATSRITVEKMAPCNPLGTSEPSRILRAGRGKSGARAPAGQTCLGPYADGTTQPRLAKRHAGALSVNAQKSWHVDCSIKTGLLYKYWASNHSETQV